MTDPTSAHLGPADDPALRIAHAGELTLIGTLLDTPRALTASGASLLWRYLRGNAPTDPADPLEQLRAHTVDRLVEVMALETGVPASYWHDQQPPWLPDDLATLPGYSDATAGPHDVDLPDPRPPLDRPQDGLEHGDQQP